VAAAPKAEVPPAAPAAKDNAEGEDDAKAEAPPAAAPPVPAKVEVARPARPATIEEARARYEEKMKRAGEGAEERRRAQLDRVRREAQQAREGAKPKSPSR
jgi:hypothetical protein